LAIRWRCSICMSPSKGCPVRRVEIIHPEFLLNFYSILFQSFVTCLERNGF
jgi:hypothetical protein